MGSKKIISAIEFGETNLKLIVAEKDNNNIFVYQSFIFPCNGFKNGQIVDEEEMVKCLTKAIKDIKNKLDFNLNTAVLSIPSDELKLFKLKEKCRTSNEYTVTDLDIEGLRSQCKRRNPGNGLSIVEVIPTQYQIAEPPKYDELTTYDEAPIGKKSEILVMDCSILAIPSASISAYRALLAKVGIELKSYYLEDLASYEAYKDLVNKENIVQINIGSTSTTTAVFHKGKLEGTVKIDAGSNNIDGDIAAAFGIDEKIASRLKIKFGNALEEKADNSVIYYAKNKVITNKQLAAVIEKRITLILERIKEEILPFIKYGNFEVSLIGMGGFFFNIKEKIASFFGCEVIEPTPPCFGIRSATFTSMYGLLKLAQDDNFEIDAYATRTKTFTSASREADVSVRLDDIEVNQYLDKYDEEDFK